MHEHVHACACVHVHVCMCMCMCMCACVHVHVCMCMCACVHVQVRMPMCMCACACVHVHMHVCMCMCACVHVCMCKHVQAFDCISHKLLIAKLKAYGFANNSLELISDYLSDRKQRTKIGERFSTCQDIIYGVPQGSILGPLITFIEMTYFYSLLALK